MLRDIVGDEGERILRSARAVLLAGLPGSGKSTIAGILADEYGFERLSSDEIRMIGFPTLHKAGPRSEAHDQETMALARDWVYLEIARRAWNRLAGDAEAKVVIDATNADERRDLLAAVVTRALGDPGLAVWLVCRTPKEVRASRLQRSDPNALWLLEDFERRIARGEASLPEGSEYKGLAILEVPTC